MRTRIVALGLVSIATIIGGVLIFRTPSSTSVKAQTHEAASLPKVGEQRQPSSKGPIPTVEPQKAPATAQAETPKKALPKYEYQKELDTYSLLRKKVFLSNEEKKQKSSLLKNENFVRSLQELLKAPRLAQDDGQQNSAALDLLFDALKGENHEIASAILKSVIEDPATENSAVSMVERKALAGVKAEVLFNWSATNPKLASQMQQWLPGPVSRNIWKNVQEEQQRNLAHSRASR